MVRNEQRRGHRRSLLERTIWRTTTRLRTDAPGRAANPLSIPSTTVPVTGTSWCILRDATFTTTCRSSSAWRTTTNSCPVSFTR